MNGKRKIAIYGGSFSPPHMGHVLSARAYLEASGADEIIIIPAKRPPHKELDGMVDDDQRLVMCDLAFAKDSVLNGACRISEFELNRDRVSYTYDTVMHFISEGYADISILIGTDMLLSFESWHRFRELFGLVTIYYVDRYDDSREEARVTSLRFTEEYGARIVSLNVPPFEVSSSSVREMLSTGKPLDGLIPERVLEYILKNGLYK